MRLPRKLKKMYKKYNIDYNTPYSEFKKKKEAFDELANLYKTEVSLKDIKNEIE